MNTGFIGVGSMGGMLVRALLRAGKLSPPEVWIANRSPQKRASLAAEFPGVHTANNREVAKHCDLIFLCVGGGDTPSVLAEMDADLYPGQLLLTTANVVSLKALEDRVPCRVAKLIPSITQEVAAGITLLMYGSRITEDDRRSLEDLLGSISHAIAVAESQARPAVSLTSGAPALIAYLLQSMADAAVQDNPEITAEMAQRMVQETAAATITVMEKKKMTPQDVIQRVAVPGGMTALSIDVLSRSVPQAWAAIFQQIAEKEKQSRRNLAL